MPSRSSIQENLLSLYLRLNGYFTTGFIVHSPQWGNNRTELDALAVRFPDNKEPERYVENSCYLNRSKTMIDFAVCEVKSEGQTLEFNPSLREDSAVIRTLLEWMGIPSRTQEIATGVQNIFQRTHLPDIPTFEVSDTIRVRAFLCSPERWQRTDNEPWFITGGEIFDYTWKCLCPTEPRDTCSTQYAFGMWGEELGRLVQYFKTRKHRGENSPGTIEDIYRRFGVQNQRNSPRAG